ncbi:hypothetical protein ULF88_01925 [Halopseudomonas pachastrellae]|nr:hypothetical protein [Halopseudomonas pachastrellae]
MQELMFLGLFVLALAIGCFWGAVRPSRLASCCSRTGVLSTSSILLGLNYLLNEQPDEAIETFIRALEVNPETVETHIAIGKLFCVSVVMLSGNQGPSESAGSPQSDA